jgi:hypothetical protein
MAKCAYVADSIDSEYSAPADLILSGLVCIDYRTYIEC